MKTLRAIVETQQKRRPTTVDITLAADLLAQPPTAPDVHEHEKEEPTEKPAVDEERQVKPPDTTMAP